MALYLPAELIKQAQVRLAKSRAQPRLVDYLVFKRALQLSGGSGAEVTSGTRSDKYQQALMEWTRSGRDEDATAYFNPFEPTSTKTGGYRTKKYESNGPDNTWGGWQSALDPTPVVHVKGSSSPKRYSLATISSEDLARHFLRAELDEPGIDHRPFLIDLAIWWLRSRDLETLGISSADEPQKLVDVLIRETGLSGDEIRALFITVGEQPALSEGE
ncbi:hypothetical protein [Cellulomonas sp. PS-H5]|uniref:hypothetical protein n=1 Tax=Cellulomonas sp. PS-H5 TaxID=2820400 RepID=UPI001C4FA1FB|nr:hypothetical protein [Cellulomonas sp. PS-H5]MBW0252605.1 hypothetical protein [Cellulomonas sp. PS-H5]